MSTSDASPRIPRKAGEETYAYRNLKGHNVALTERRAESYAAFFTPYLHAGMRLLDCGCGPGSITCDLAAIVAPGEVVGIDFNPQVVEAAVAYAAQHNVANARYQPANVYALPFPDASFDAVFSHALLDHLVDPLKAVLEMRRVLRPGGVLGIRAPDMDGTLIAPVDSACSELLFHLLKELQRIHGEDACVGKHLRGLFHQAGCTNVIATASYTCHGTPESLHDIAAGAQGAIGSVFIPAGLLSPERGAELVAALQAWAEDPAAFLARNWCEAVGWVP